MLFTKEFTNLDKVKHEERKHVIYCGHVLGEPIHDSACKKMLLGYKL